MSATDRGSFSSWPFWLRALGALLAGGLTPLAFAPFDLWPLALLMPALFWLSLKRQSAARCGWLGWLFGLGFYGVGTSWVYVSIHTYGNASPLLAGLLTAAFVAGMALFSAAQGWMFGRLFGRTGARQWLGFVGLWVIWEWVRSWLLTGFPWLYLGYPLLDTPLAAWAPLGGVWLASLAALLLGVGSVQLLAPQPPSRRNERILPAALISLVLLVPLLLQGAWTKPVGEPLRVGLVQGDIPQQLKWQRDLLPDILNRYRTLSMGLGDVDLLIWPETAIPAPLERAEPYLAPFLDALAAEGTGLIAGLPSILTDAEAPSRRIFHNSLALLSPERAVYHKQRLVPFGEYVPLETLLRGLIDFFDLPMSSFSLPQTEQPPLPFRDHRLAAAICYEIAYPELVRRESLESDLLLTVSNDTWFGHSIAPDQHLQIARMRALENGRWLIRATNNGISALVDANGRIRAEAPRYQTALLAGEVQGMQGLTPFQRLGAWPALALALFGCLIATPRLQRRRLSASRAGDNC